MRRSSDDDELLVELAELAHRAEIELPGYRMSAGSVAYVEFETSTLVLPSDVVALDPETRLGVLAHEVAHLVLHRRKGRLRRGWRTAGPLLLATVLIVLVILLRSGLGRDHQWLVLSTTFAAGVMVWLDGLRAARRSRRRETEADLWAASMVGKEAAIRGVRWSSARTKRRKGWWGWSASHPPCPARVATIDRVVTGRR